MKAGEIWLCTNPFSMIVGNIEEGEWAHYRNIDVNPGDRVRIVKLVNSTSFMLVIVELVDREESDIYIPSTLFISSFEKVYGEE